jgi:hypothetical protein
MICGEDPSRRYPRMLRIVFPVPARVGLGKQERVTFDSKVLRYRLRVLRHAQPSSHTHAQTTASRPKTTAVHGSRHTAPSHSFQAVMACRAHKTVLWLVCKDPSRSLLGASRITCRALRGQIYWDRLSPTSAKSVPVYLPPESRVPAPSDALAR